MFKKFFSKNNKAQPKKIPNPLFDLFPLDQAEQDKISNFVHDMLGKMFGAEVVQQMRDFSLEYPVQKEHFGKLSFDGMDWKRDDEDGEFILVCEQTGGYMHIATAQPEGKLKPGQTNTVSYRNWLRKQYIEFGGGVIFCEAFRNQHGVEGFEAISKVPKGKDEQGIDYVYFLNLQNFDENLLYQVSVKMFEQGTPGLRDNLLMQPFMQIAKIENPQELMQHYFRDPYDHSNKEGLPMNVAENEVFDALFPVHPLSIIRQAVRGRLVESLKWG